MQALGCLLKARELSLPSFNLNIKDNCFMWLPGPWLGLHMLRHWHSLESRHVCLEASHGGWAAIPETQALGCFPMQGFLRQILRVTGEDWLVRACASHARVSLIWLV